MGESVHNPINRREYLTVKTVAVTPEPQVKVDELEIPQEPFDDFSVNPEPKLFLH